MKIQRYLVVLGAIALTILPGTHAASASEDDDILLLVVPSIVAANRVQLSADSLAPLKLLTVTGRRFDPTATIAVRFFDDQGFDVDVLVAEATATSVTVAVPPFIDRTAGEFSAGTVDVQVVQKKGGVTRRSIAVPGFQIQDLPQTGLSPGLVTLEVLDQMLSLLETTAQNYLVIKEASLGTVDASQLLQELLAAIDAYSEARALTQQLVNGEVGQVNLGEFDGEQVFLDQNVLALLDRLYVAYLVDGSGIGGVGFTNSIGAGAQSASTIESIRFKFDLLRVVVCATISPFDLTERILDEARRERGMVAAAFPIATLLATIASGGSIPALGGLSAAAFFAVTIPPAIQATVLQAGAGILCQGEVKFEDFEPIFTYLDEATTDRVITEGLGFFARWLGPVPQLVGIAVIALDSLISETTGSKSFIVALREKFGTIRQLLTPATLTDYFVAVGVIDLDSGRVTSSPPGIDCPGDCSEIYDSGTVPEVTLTPHAEPGFEFESWQLGPRGTCTGAGPCNVLAANGDQGILAKFIVAQADGFVTIDSLSCDVFTFPPDGVHVSHVEFSGSASGPVGTRLLTDQSRTDCPEWPVVCLRQVGEPSTTTWTAGTFTNTSVTTFSIAVTLVISDPFQILEFSKTLTCPGF